MACPADWLMGNGTSGLNSLQGTLLLFSPLFMPVWPVNVPELTAGTSERTELPSMAPIVRQQPASRLPSLAASDPAHGLLPAHRPTPGGGLGKGRGGGVRGALPTSHALCHVHATSLADP